MSSQSQKSFASRLGNAKTLRIRLSTFTDYQPLKEEASLAALGTSINALETLQESYTSNKKQYKDFVEKRQLLFTDQEDSLEKRLSPIRATLEALYGKDSNNYKQINSLIQNIRGQSTKAKSSNQEDEEQEEKQVSQVETTFASRTSDFKQILTLLKTLATEYTPPNPLITIEALTQKVQELETVNSGVDATLSILKPIIKNRQSSFKALSEQTQSIKNFVKAQYGVSSDQYNQIKGLFI